MSDFCVAGVDLGGTKIYTVLASSRGEVLAERKIPTEAEKGLQHVIARILESVEQVKRDAPPSFRLRALALGAPGPLDSSRGIIHFAPNLNWHNVPIRAILEEKTGFRVLLDNDANLAALGEHLYGAGRGADNMVFITISTGVGGGLILDGKLYRGSAGGAGEIGHMTIDWQGPQCSCGSRGCLEALIAIPRLLAKYQQSTGKALTFAQFKEKVAGGDEKALEIVDFAGGVLGVGLVNVCNLLNPQLIVVGGELSLLGELLRQKLCQVISLNGLPGTKDVQVQLAGPHSGGELVGAASLVVEKMFALPVMS